MADEVVQGLNDIEVAKWNRQTVADGSWMQSYTLNPLSARDVYLANAIDTEIADRISADNELQDQIDTLEMSTDVVDVWGNYTTFTAGSATKYFPEDKPAEITFNDIIKVLNDEETPIIPDDPETTGHQTYWQLVRKEGSTAKKPTTANSKWNYIGYVDPYYSTHEVDNIIDELSSTIQDEYIPWSAQEGLVGEDNEFASNNVTAAWAFGKGNSANYGSLTVGQTNSASYGGSIGEDNKSNYGFAAGTNNTANSYSLAVGSTNSSYQDSLTVGNSNSANLYAGAIGSHVSAGTQSFAAGENTTAYQNSLAIGSTVSANTDTFSLGVQTTGSNYSIAVGSNVKAKDKSLAVGFNASANVDSIAVGEDNSANSNSIAIGSGNSANENSQAFGKGNVITNSGAVFGAYNKTSSNIAFVIGNGTGTAIEDRSDLFLIDKNGGVSSKSFSGVSGIFENISATNISATIKLSAESATINNATITNVTGTTAKFTGFSGTNISASDGSTTATIENLITSAEGGSAANAWLVNNTSGNSAKYALSAEKVKWSKGTDNSSRPIGFANADQEAQWIAGNVFYDEIIYDSEFNYNPVTNTLSSKYISANTVSANLSGTADKATSAAKAEHTQDSLTSIGSGTNAILYVSSLNLSAGSGLKWSSAAKTLGIGIDLQTTTVDNVVKISSIGGSALYSQVLSGGRCIEVNTADNSINLSSTVSADKFYTSSTNLTNEINSSGLYFLYQSGPNASYTKLKNDEIILHYFTNNNNFTTNINSEDVSSTINTLGTSNTYTATWEDILKASKGDFSDKTISANLITTSSTGASTATTLVNAGNITLVGAGGGGGSTVTFNVTGISTTQGDISYTTLANMNYVSSNNTITALVSATQVGTNANTVYLV